MKLRIQSRAKSIQVDQASRKVKSKLILINEILEFDHLPTGEEIQAAIAALPKYASYRVQFLETLAIQKVSE